MSDQSTALSLNSPGQSASLDLFNPERWSQALAIAKAFAGSQMVPLAFQKNVENCIVAIDIASRMGASPFTVMQNLNVIHGKPSWASSFIIAMINASGRFSPMRFRYTGTVGQDDRTCVAHAVSAVDKQPLDGAPVSIKMAKSQGWWGKSGSKWPDMHELMLMYRAATFFGRMYAPDMMAGLKTEEEVYDIDPAPAVTGASTTVLPKVSRKNAGGLAEMKTVKEEKGTTEEAPEDFKLPPDDEPEPTTPPPAPVKKDETPPPPEKKEEEPVDITPPAGPAAQRCNIVAFTQVKASTSRGFVMKIDLGGDDVAITGYMDVETEKVPPVGTLVDAVVERRKHPTKDVYNNMILSLTPIK